MASTKSAAIRGGVQAVFSLKPAAVAVAVALTLGGGARLALANPTGATVVNGQVTMNQAGNLLSITNSPNSIINWQGFSIGANEITRFMQQSASSAILNRVVGAGGSIDPSVILGALQSNGRVFLINPAGIAFGAGSQIDVAGLVASSLNLSNADFLGGRLRFTEVPGAGAVVNQGSINAASGGQVYLVGPSVTNNGIITSPKGEVILAAGNTVELVNPGTPNLRVEVTAPQNEAKNLGSIVADAGRVGIYAGLITQNGTIRADSAVATDDGRIILKATKDVSLGAGSITTANGPAGGRIEVNAGDTALVAGKVEAKGASGQGGVVHVLGDKVGIYGNARVDVSGETGGGTVLAGGEFQGGAGVSAVEGAAIRNANFTFFGSDSAISADAIASGDGGKIIVWSDNTTRSYGAISARGGAASGNGGFVETSGKKTLDVTRGPDLRAPNGLGGTWLLDPSDLEVVAGTEITSNTAQPLFSALADSSRIGVDLINLQLNFGSNVVLTTANQGPGDGSQQGNITVSAPIVKSASSSTEPGGLFIGTTSLTLLAHNNIVINPGGSITSTGDPLDVSLRANFFNPGTGVGGVTVNDAILTNGGALSITGRGPIALNAPVSTVRTIGIGDGYSNGISLTSTADSVNVGATMISGSFFSASGATGVAINGTVLTPNDSSITLTSSTGPVTVGGAVTGGAFSASGATGVAINGTVLTPDDSPITLTSSAGLVTVGGAVTGGAFSADGFTGVTIGGEVHANSSSFPAGCGFNFTSFCAAGHTGTITLAAPVTTTGSAFLIADNMAIQAPLNAGSGSIVVLPSTVGRPMNLGSEAGALSLTQGELSNFITSGSVTYGNFSTGAFTVSAPVTVGSDSVTMSSGVSFTVNSGASVTTAAPLTVAAHFVNLGGQLSAADVTFSNVGTMAVNALVQAPTGTITVNSSNPVNLGNGAGGGLHLDAAELANLSAPTLRISSNGTMMVQGPVARAGTLSLQGSTLTQAAGGTLAVSDLDLFSFSSVNLPQDNDVDRLAGFASNTFNFVQKPGKLLTIAPVGFISGVQSSSGSINLTSDMLDVASGSSVRAGPSFGSPTGAVNIMPRSPGVRLDLGGADGANVLGISQTDLDGIFANQLTLKADRADISSQVSFISDVLAIAPLTSGLALNVVSTKTAMPTPGVTPLEFLPGELNLVTGNSFVLGDATGTGPVNVSAAVDLTAGPGNLQLFTLRSASTAGITVSAPLTARSVALIGDDLTLTNAVTASATGGSLIVAPNGGGTPIDLGNNAGSGTLGLSTTEIGLLHATNGTVFIGNSVSGIVNVTEEAVFTNAGTLNVTSGSAIDVHGVNGSNPRLEAPGPVFLSAPAITIHSPVRSTVSGSVNLAANTMDIGAAVTTANSSNGDINVRPLSVADIELGGSGTFAFSLTNTELGFFDPASELLRIGDLSNVTREIRVTGAISPALANNLSLLTSNSGGQITQTGAGTIAASNLAARSRNNVTLTLDNTASNVSLQSTNGSVSYTYVPPVGPGPLPLTVAATSVDPANVSAGVNAQSGNVTLTTDDIDIQTNVRASNSFGVVTLVPRSGISAMTPRGVTLGTETANTLSVSNSELGLITGRKLAIGDANTHNVTVTGAANIGTSDLDVTTHLSRSFIVNASSPLSVPGTLTVSTGTVTTNTSGTISAGNVTMSADSMTFGAAVNASPFFGTITLAQLGTLTVIDLGGADVVSTTNTLGLDSTDVMNLHAANFIIGNTSTSSIATTTAPTHFAASSSATLRTKAGGPITVNAGAALDNTGNLTLNGGGNAAITLHGAVASTGGALSISTGSGGSITANAPLSSAFNLSLNAAGAGSITANNSMTSTSGALSLTTGTMGSITVNSGALSGAGTTTLTADTIAIPGGSISGANVMLSTPNNRIVNLGTLAMGADFALDQNALNRITTPGTLTVTTGTINVTDALSFPNSANLALRANTMDIGNTVTLNGTGSVLSVAPRNSNFLRLGGAGGAGGLELTDAEIDRLLVPNGVLRLGDQATTSRVSVEGPISIDPASAGAVALIASSSSGIGIDQAAGATITAGNLRLQSSGQINLTEANAVGMLAGSSGSNFNFTNAALLTVGGTVDGVSGLSGGTLVLRADDLALTGPGFISNNNVTLAPRNAGAAMNLGSSPGGVFGVDATELAQITGNNLTFGIKAAGNNPTGPVVVSAPMVRTGGSSRRLNIDTGATQTVDINAALSAPFNIAVDAGTINVSAPVTTTGSGSVNLTSRAAALNINAAITSASDVDLNSDAININAAVTANQISGTVSIAPITPVQPAFPAPPVLSVPVSLGVETAGALSLTQGELAFISAPNIDIGSSFAGPITIAAPISLAVDQLTLQSGGSIGQTSNGAIQLVKTIPGETGPVKVGDLGVFSGGSVDLRAANAVPGSLSGSIASDGTFDFNNTLPMRRDIVSFNLLNVSSTAPSPLVTQRVRITGAPFVPLPVIPVTPPPPTEEVNANFQAQLLASIDKISDINDVLDATSEEDKKKAEDEKKKQTECK